MGEQIAFGLAAGAAIGSGILVITVKNAFQAAVALIATLIAVAVLFLLANAPFVAAIQVIVYAGAIVTLFLFVLAYLGDRARQTPDRLARYQVFAWLTVIVLAVMGAIVLLTTGLARFNDAQDPRSELGSPREIGDAFLQEHLLPFEVTSLLLLAAAVGAVILAKRAVQSEAGR